jgi:hypothetical protein
MIFQLFSANLQNMSASEEYVTAATKAEARMREILDLEDLAEGVWTEVTEDNRSLEVAVSEVLKERTGNLRVRVLEVGITYWWSKGLKEKALRLKTLKMVRKQV